MPPIRGLRRSSPARVTLSTAAAALRYAWLGMTVRVLRCGVGRGELVGGCQSSGYDGCGRPSATHTDYSRVHRMIVRVSRPYSEAEMHSLTYTETRPACLQIH